ncbi:hypothetical protein GGF46_005297 [Coemansia sp. RSA 552]|nr:hypothetical protein GGF46_005297 [Coemansia sp. RSA 552]
MTTEASSKEERADTPISAVSNASDLDLGAVQSPPMLVQSPRIDQAAVEMRKRTRADIATPRKPGSSEARAQIEAEFINTPDRAPPAMKRLMRSASPLATSDDTEPIQEATHYSSPLPPPKFDLIDSRPSLEKTPITRDQDIFGSSPVGSGPAVIETLGSVEDADSSMAVDPRPEVVFEDSDIEFTTARADAMAIVSGDGTPVPKTVLPVIERVAPETVMAAALAATAPSATTELSAATALSETTVPAAAIALSAGTSLPATPTAGSTTPQQPEANTQISVGHKGKPAELTMARVLEDPELMQAAAVPLPGTPSMGAQEAVTPAGQRKDPADFNIPTDWLMDLGSGGRGGQQAGGAADSPLRKYSSPAGDGDGSLIPVTPANQKLLDSLEIQWVSPRQVPKFSEAEVEAIRAEYEEQMQRQNELRDKVLQALKVEYAENMRKKEDDVQRALDEASTRSRAHEEELRQAQQRHSEELAQRAEESRRQAEEFGCEIDNALGERAQLIAARDEASALLDDYVATSSKMIEEKEAENMGLTRELGKLTLDRQRLQEELEEALTQAEALGSERDEAQTRAEALSAESTRLEQTASALRNDVLIAEERSAKIKEHAEGTLGRANAEIGSLHDQLVASRQETADLKAQATKADARARSLQIQLDTMKRQNQELLALAAFGTPVFLGGNGVVDPLTGSGSFVSGAGAVDAGGNSFLRVDQDTRIQGQNIVGLNQDSVTGQQGGPGFAADGAVVVVTTN